MIIRARLEMENRWRSDPRINRLIELAMAVDDAELPDVMPYLREHLSTQELRKLIEQIQRWRTLR